MRMYETVHYYRKKPIMSKNKGEKVSAMENNQKGCIIRKRLNIILIY